MWNQKWRLLNPTEEGAEGSPPVSEAPAAPSDDSNIWDDLLDEGVEEVVAEEATAEAEPAKVVGGEPEPAPAAEAVVAVEAPPAATAVVEKPVEVAPAPVEVVSQAPVEEAPVQPQYVPTQEEREFLRKQAMVGLAERYKLTEEDATALQVEPEKVLPRLAANVHAAIYQDVLQRVYAEAPALIRQSLQEQESTRRAEEAFFSRWEGLRAHRAEVEKFAPIWRQMYPQASLEQAIEGIGSTISAMLGVNQAQVAAQTPPPPPPPPAGPSSRMGMAPTPRSRLSPEEQSFVELSKTFEEEL